MCIVHLFYVDLEKDVYMKLPESLYGLKQYSRCWFAILTKAIFGYGFKHGRAVYSIFSIVCGKVLLQNLLYVDDHLVTGSLREIFQEFKTYLSSFFPIKDLKKIEILSLVGDCMTRRISICHKITRRSLNGWLVQLGNSFVS